MELIWSKDDNPEKPKHDREFVRNAGQLLGRLDEILPFIYIAQYGASNYDLRQRKTEVSLGLFAVGEKTGGDHPGVATRVGFILPISKCQDEKARAALLEIPELMKNLESTTMSDRRVAVQAKLDIAFDGDLKIDTREELNGFFALKPGRGLFRRLHESFDYVVSVTDNAAGAIRVQNTSKFRWSSYGELMEWYNGLRGEDRFGGWTPLTPFYVCGDTGALQSYSSDRWAQRGLIKPTEEPSKWFVINPTIPNACFSVRLEMEEYGWAKLHLTLNHVTTVIYLSDVFDPFPELVAWGREIDEGDLPIQIEINEEGRTAVLTVLRTDDPSRVLLRVTRRFENETFLEGIVDRSILASALKTEMKRFFTSEFNQMHWDRDHEEDPDADYVPTCDYVLGHRWFKS